ncbi:hypothetical protein POJ06DRAFT_240984 [Lipomyces tetrasporus]|uniref:Uncharacterized protein n=1 Tax=Lipomyces tetrasporus TaxID=54092 RepID=A0AAD7VPC2_9ASCO|nr:uncharacterized protein POJ06DRAFT_240984 [Lipomyces tetrasporus]KAJ8096953.1 hypothetical protein POJ06DRAFT_240984 [Lipomyces tetrasporus]
MYSDLFVIEGGWLSKFPSYSTENKEPIDPRSFRLVQSGQLRNEDPLSEGVLGLLKGEKIKNLLINADLTGIPLGFSQGHHPLPPAPPFPSRNFVQSSKKQSKRAVFEDDATGADEDAVTFSNCMKDVFGIDDVEDFAIEKTSKFAGFDVHEWIIANLERLLQARSLLIITYIGHGVIDIESKRLQLISENGSQRML